MTEEFQLTACPTEQLILYHYGELEAGVQLQVEKHLQRCRACRAELSDLRDVLALIPSAVPKLTAGELQSFNSRVMTKVSSRRHRLGRPAFGWALAGAVVVLLTLNLRPQIESPVPASAPVEMAAEQEVLNRIDLLKDLDLLENLDLLQQLDALG